MPIRRVKLAINPPLRSKPRLKRATFKKVDLKRAIDAIKRVGLDVGAVEIRPDGTISIRTPTAAPDNDGSLFDEWQDQL